MSETKDDVTLDDDGHIEGCGNGGEDPRDCSPACVKAQREAERELPEETPAVLWRP